MEALPQPPARPAPVKRVLDLLGIVYCHPGLLGPQDPHRPDDLDKEPYFGVPRSESDFIGIVRAREETAGRTLSATAEENARENYRSMMRDVTAWQERRNSALAAFAEWKTAIADAIAAMPSMEPYVAGAVAHPSVWVSETIVALRSLLGLQVTFGDRPWRWRREALVKPLHVISTAHDVLLFGKLSDVPGPKPEEWLPSGYFRREWKISPDRLRKAAKAGAIRFEKRGKFLYYLFAEVKGYAADKFVRVQMRPLAESGGPKRK